MFAASGLIPSWRKTRTNRGLTSCHHRLPVSTSGLKYQRWNVFRGFSFQTCVPISKSSPRFVLVSSTEIRLDPRLKRPEDIDRDSHVPAGIGRGTLLSRPQEINRCPCVVGTARACSDLS